LRGHRATRFAITGSRVQEQAEGMQIGYRWIKDDNGALDADFVASLTTHFGIKAFVESGAYLGDTLAAMRPLFNRLMSVELSPVFARRAGARFAGDDTITIIEADSASGLAQAFAMIPREPALIWLDAHYSGGPTAKGRENTPILDELRQIMEGRDGRDVILIDDARLFWPVPSGFEHHDTLEGYPLLSDIAQILGGAPHHYEIFALGDALLAAPKGLSSSSVLAACTLSRLAPPGSQANPAVEAAICAAVGSERDALSRIEPLIENQRVYGLGGHYYFWRGLLREQQGHAAAADDLAFAARCAVTPGVRRVRETG